MSSSYDGERASDKTVWIVLGIVGAVVLVCGGAIALVIGGMFFLGRGAVAQFETISGEIDAEMAAEEFLERIGSNRLDAAYRSTSTGFRQRQTLEQFRAMIDRQPKLKNQRSATTETESINGNSAELGGTVVAADGTEIEVTLEMVKEAGKWKVNRFTVP